MELIDRSTSSTSDRTTYLNGASFVIRVNTNPLRDEVRGAPTKKSRRPPLERELPPLPLPHHPQRAHRPLLRSVGEVRVAEVDRDPPGKVWRIRKSDP